MGKRPEMASTTPKRTAKEAPEPPAQGGPRPPFYRRRAFWLGGVVAFLIAFAAADYAVDYALAHVPLPEEVELDQTARVYDRHGNLIATYRNEITRFMIDSGELPEHVLDAIVAAEDRDFYEHDGISVTGIVRAAWANLTSRQVEQGGSTISQQYIKNAVLEDSSRTVERKSKEALLAMKLERRYTKDQILNFYMNTVYFGRGAYGIEAAARTYFAKNATRLNLAEAAYLAGLIPSPQKYQPDGTQEAAKARRAYVLNAMREEGYITEAEEERARSRPLRLQIAATLKPRRQEGAYFLEWLRKEYLYPRFGECLFRCGLKIHTTIDMEMQEQAEGAVAETLDEDGDPQAALVSMTPKGKVRAMVGRRNAFDVIRKARGFNFATDSKRHAGSAFKPFTLLTAIEDDISTDSRFSGHTPKTIEDDACNGPEGEWSPENYEGSSFGTIDLQEATTNSVNTVFAELISEVGPQKVADLVSDMGFSGPKGNGKIPAVCSLALGTLDVSPLEMARAYATFAARGIRPEVTPIRFIDDADGKCLVGYGTPKKKGCKKVIDTAGERVVDENSVDVLTQALTGVVEGGTATAAQIGRPVAGKTGTTQENRDAWFAGYTPQLTTVVWMGYPIRKGPDGKFGTGDDVSPLMRYCSSPITCIPVHGIEVTGGSFPATIWGLFMQQALDGTDVIGFPTPIDEPDTVLNPPPPPPPPKKEKGKEDRGRGNDQKEDGGNGNEGTGGPGND